MALQDEDGLLALKRSQEVSDHMLWIVKDPFGLFFGTEVSVVKRNNEFIGDFVSFLNMEN